MRGGAVLVCAERAVFSIIKTPVNRRVVGIALIDPHDALWFEFWKKRDKDLLKKVEIVTGIIRRSCTVRGTLPPIWWTGDEDIYAGIRQPGNELETITFDNGIGGK